MKRSIKKDVLSILRKTGRSKEGEAILTSRESTELEYKESFSILNFKNTLNTIAGFANNKGGMILYGVKDSPKIPIGMKNSKFEDTDDAKIQSIISEYLSGIIEFDIQTIHFNKKAYGAVYVYESSQKPVIIKKNGNGLKEGEIYFRYRGQTRRISYEELQSILEENKMQQIKKWFDIIKKVDEVGIENVEVFDARSGALSLGEKRVIIDQSILNDLTYVRKGEFDEVKGAPAIKIVGEVKNVGKVVATRKVKTDRLDDYPYSATEMANKVKEQAVNANLSQIWKIIAKYDLKNNPKYSAYNFRNKGQREAYKKTKKLQSSTPSIYNEKAVRFIVSKIP